MASSPYGSGGYIRKPDFAVNDKSATPTDTGMDGQFVRDYFMDDEKDRKRLTPTDTELDRQIDELLAELEEGIEQGYDQAKRLGHNIQYHTFDTVDETKAQIKQLIARERQTAGIQMLRDTADGFESELLPEFEKGGRAAINALRAMADHLAALQAQEDKEVV